MTVRRCFLTGLLIAAIAMPVGAQGSSPASATSRGKGTLLFLAGAATGLGLHESGHLISGRAFGAHPRVRRLDYGPIPFFVILHDPVSRKREFIISSAGFWMQHAGSEWLLSARPQLRDEEAPFLKGLLAFNIGASLVYSTAAFGRFGPSERDTRSMAASLGNDGVPEPVIGLLVLAPAALDAYRYRNPDAGWAKWTSRGAKIVMVVLTMAAGR
jgi:hypothetical protein